MFYYVRHRHTRIKLRHEHLRHLSHFIILHSKISHAAIATVTATPKIVVFMESYVWHGHFRFRWLVFSPILYSHFLLLSSLSSVYKYVVCVCSCTCVCWLPSYLTSVNYLLHWRRTPNGLKPHIDCDTHARTHNDCNHFWSNQQIIWGVSVVEQKNEIGF